MTAPIRAWLAEPLSPEVRRALDRLAARDDVVHVAVMPDAHLAEDVCIGTVVATGGTLIPAAVGGDIGCGVATVRLEGDASWLDDRRRAAAVLDGLGRAVPTIRHPRGGGPAWPEALARPLSHPALDAAVRKTAVAELGTVGRGNHFVELQTDGDGRAWLMIHSGSRAMGQAIREHHLRGAAAGAGPLRGLAAASAAGRAYLDDVDWALAYADENRRAIADAVARVLVERIGVGLEAATWTACHHNHVRRERHGGREVWVHRKGAIPAAAGEAGLIPGSMGTASFHVVGRGEPDALASSAHGAGRRFGRGEARRRISAAALVAQVGSVWFDRRLADALRDEAPGAYKDIDAVMRAQRALVKVVRAVAPRLVFKGGG